MSTEDAKRWYDQVHSGDVVTVINSKDTVATNNGYGDWNVDWAAWKAGSALDRFARTARQAAELPARAGHADVAGNLVAITLTLLDSLNPAVVALALTRPAATLRIRQALEAGAPGFTVIQDAVTSYLDEERRLGRLAKDTDTASVALALVGAVHHLLMTGWAGAPDPREQTERLVAQLVGPSLGERS